MSLSKLINALGEIENPFDGMTFRMPYPKAPIRQPKMLSPLRKRHGLAVVGKPDVAASVNALSFAARPLAIFLAVVTVIVKAFKGHALTRQPHIGEEVLKFVPPLANFNSPRSIVGKARHVRIVASAEHGIPQIVDRCFAHAVRSSSVSGRMLTGEAPAGGGIAALEICETRQAGSTALAPASPFRNRLPAARDSLYSREKAKLLPCNVKNSSFHEYEYLPCVAGNQAGTVT